MISNHYSQLYQLQRHWILLINRRWNIERKEQFITWGNNLPTEAMLKQYIFHISWLLLSADRRSSNGFTSFTSDSEYIHGNVWRKGTTDSTCKPRVWKRYVDDTYCIMDRRCTDSFLQHLNSRRDIIKFTMEREKNCSLPF